MVMEEEPSPEFVGREFVRQYYTVLHACPENLHRFYSTDSSFVHGGLEQPGESSTRVAKGQAEIHKRIMSLNLRECRAKIRQVDSFETVNGALVIQVIGELGNSGEAMRRFVQTFVLVQQSPKSYYVNNDIFRYQDDVFRDEETESNVQVKNVAVKQRPDDAVVGESGGIFAPAQPPQDHHVPSSTTDSYANGSWSESEEKKVSHHQTVHPASSAVAAYTQPQQTQPAAPQRGQPETQQPMAVDQQSKPKQTQRNDRERSNANNASSSTAPVAAAVPNASETDSDVAAVEVSAPPAVVPPAKDANNKGSDSHGHDKGSAVAAAPVSSKPLTFAAVAGGGRTSPAIPTNANNRPAQTSSQKSASAKPSGSAGHHQREKSPEHSPHGSISGGDDSDGQHHSAAEGHHHAPQQTTGTGGNAAGGFGGRGNFRSAYPNEQQVFVGNLPQDVTDEELQEFMTKFGGVVDVKICGKTFNRPGPGRVTPAFAFVTFENVEAVDKMLGTLPINDFRGHMRLNIERKQERFSGGYRGGQNFSGQSSNAGGQMGGGGGRGGIRGMPGRRFAGPPRGGGGNASYDRQ